MNKNNGYIIRYICNFSLLFCSIFYHTVTHGKDIKAFNLDNNTIGLWHMDSIHKESGFIQVHDATGNFNLQQTRNTQSLQLIESDGGSGKSITGFNNKTGSLDLVDAVKANLSDSTPQTFEAWVKWDNDYALPKRKASVKQTVMTRLVGSSSSAWLFFVNNQIKLSIRSGDGRRDEKIYTAVVNPRSGVWYHVAFTIEVDDFDQQGDKKDTRVKLYFNDSTNTDTTPNPLKDLTTGSRGVIYEDFEYRANGWLYRLGKRYRISNANFRGYIDDVRLSNIARTNFEVFQPADRNDESIPTVSSQIPINPKPSDPVEDPATPTIIATDSLPDAPLPTEPVEKEPIPTPDITQENSANNTHAFNLDSNTIGLWRMDSIHNNAGYNQVHGANGNFTLQQTRNAESLQLVTSDGGSGKSIKGFNNNTGSLDLVYDIQESLSDSYPQTFEAWIKWENDDVLPKSRASVKQTIMTRLVSSSSSAWLFFVNNQIKLSIRSGDGRRDEKIYTAVANPRSGVWYHVAFTIEVNDFDQQADKMDTRVKLYFNQANNTDTTPQPLEDIATKLKGVVYEDFVYRANGWLFRIGKRYGISNANFRGIIDEVRLSKVAKTNFEVFQSSENDIATTPSDPVEEPAAIPESPVAVAPEPTPPVTEESTEPPVYSVTPIDPVLKEPTDPVAETPLPTEPNIDVNTAKTTFVVMQSLLFDANKPSNNEFQSNFGINYIGELGHGFSKTWDIAGGDNPFYDAPNEDLVKDWASKTNSKIGFIDIEHLPTSFYDEWDDDWNHLTPPVKITDTDRKRAMQEMISIVDWAHEVNPELTIGYYGILPQREYWSFVVPSFYERLEKLQQRNEMFSELADHVDVLFPSLYTFYNKPEEWKIYAKGMIDEARKYNKPTYAFIWPIYHNSNATIGGQFIGGDFWRTQLEELYALGYDGVVIWGGWKEQWNVSASDTNPDNWWYQTLAFMHSKGLLPANSTWSPK